MALEVLANFRRVKAGALADSDRDELTGPHQSVDASTRDAKYASHIGDREELNYPVSGVLWRLEMCAHARSMDTPGEEPGKGVSRRRFRPVELLALLAGAQDVIPGDEDAAAELLRKAPHRQAFFELIPNRQHFREEEAIAAAEFVQWWQDETLLRPPAGEERRQIVALPQEIEIHHHVLSRVLEARRVMLEQRSAVRLRDTYALPCKSCGRIFKTRAPHFARTCRACQKEPAYRQRLRVHELGSLPVFAGGFHAKGPERRQCVWPTVCEHPECVAVFPATRWNERYCPDHTRVSANRARRRLRVPKHKRFRFYPNYSECDEGTEIRYDLMISGERRACVIGPNGYEARDEDEFRPLAHYAAQSPPRIHVVPVDAG
jgi:hypothetical protein